MMSLYLLKSEEETRYILVLGGNILKESTNIETKIYWLIYTCKLKANETVVSQVLRLSQSVTKEISRESEPAQY